MTVIEEALSCLESGATRMYSPAELREIIRRLLDIVPLFSVGDFTISVLNDDSYWIAHDSGEGMHVSAEKLAECIAKFYEENF